MSLKPGKTDDLFLILKQFQVTPWRPALVALGSPLAVTLLAFEKKKKKTKKNLT